MIILNIERYVAYQNRGLPLGDLMVSANPDVDKKTLRKAVKTVSSVQNQQRKKQEEAARKASLTVQQKQQEAQEKKAKAAANKRKKDENYQQCLQILNLQP